MYYIIQFHDHPGMEGDHIWMDYKRKQLYNNKHMHQFKGSLLIGLLTKL